MWSFYTSSHSGNWPHGSGTGLAPSMGWSSQAELCHLEFYPGSWVPTSCLQEGQIFLSSSPVKDSNRALTSTWLKNFYLSLYMGWFFSSENLCSLQKDHQYIVTNIAIPFRKKTTFFLSKARDWSSSLKWTDTFVPKQWQYCVEQYWFLAYKPVPSLMSWCVCLFLSSQNRENEWV